MDDQGRTDNGSDGVRDGKGRFVKGNPGGPGNPYAQKTAALRKALFDAVTDEDMAAVAHTVVEKAKGGDMTAAKLLWDRMLGPPVETDLLDRIEQLEAELASRTRKR